MIVITVILAILTLVMFVKYKNGEGSPIYVLFGLLFFIITSLSIGMTFI